MFGMLFAESISKPAVLNLNIRLWLTVSEIAALRGVNNFPSASEEGGRVPSRNFGCRYRDMDIEGSHDF